MDPPAVAPARTSKNLVISVPPKLIATVTQTQVFPRAPLETSLLRQERGPAPVHRQRKAPRASAALRVRNALGHSEHAAQFRSAPNVTAAEDLFHDPPPRLQQRVAGLLAVWRKKRHSGCVPELCHCPGRSQNAISNVPRGVLLENATPNPRKHSRAPRSADRGSRGGASRPGTPNSASSPRPHEGAPAGRAHSKPPRAPGRSRREPRPTGRDPAVAKRCKRPPKSALERRS